MSDFTDYELYAETAVQIAYDRTISRSQREAALGQLGVIASGLQRPNEAEPKNEVLASDSEAKEDATFLASMRRNYPLFQEAIYATLNADADDSQIGKGGYSTVHRMRVNESDYAIKIAEPITILYLVRAFRRAQILDGLAHLHAINIEQGRLVMDLMPGKRISDTSYNEIIGAPEEHVL